MDFSAEEQALLIALLQLSEHDHVPDTEAVAVRMREILERKGLQWFPLPNRPWYGTDDAVLRLEKLGLVEVDPGIAPVIPPGAPAPEAKRFWFVLTDEGSRVAHELQTAQPPA